MPTHKRFIQVVLLVIALSGCKEPDDGPEPTIADVAAPSIKLTTIAGTNSTLQATYFSTIVDSGFIGKITYIQGWGHAHFKSSNGAIIKPQWVATEGTQLNQKLGKYSSSPGNTQGIDFGSSVIWDVSETVLNPAIKEVLPYKVPEIGDVNVKDSLKSSAPFDMMIDLNNPFTNLGQLDSISYLIRGKETSLIKKMNVLAPAAFTVAELKSLGKGKAYIQVEVYRYEIKTYSGFKVAFINKGVLNKPIWVY